MAYCTRANLEDRYGVTNIATYADLDADANATKITNRITRAIAVADARIDDRLRRSDLSFQLPLAKADGTIQLTLTDVAVKLAGYWLSTARGVSGYDRENGNPMTTLWGDYQDALAMLEQIADGKLKLENT